MFLALWRQPTMQPPQKLHPVLAGPSPAEVGVGDLLARLAEEDRHVRGVKGLAHPISVAISRRASSAGVSFGLTVTPSMRRAVS